MTAPASDPAAAAERRPGRPRDAAADAAILDAAVSVLAESGTAGFTVDAVAARAGCGKATIYRRWPSRSSLLLDTAHQMGLDPTPVDTGSLRSDMVTLLTELARKMRETEAGRILPSVVAEAGVRPEMRELLTAWIHDRRQRPREIVGRAIERGELRADTDVELLVDLLGGTVIYRELIAGQRTGEPDVERIVDAVLPGFVHAGSAPDADH
jgi:AcrR family transcriptional regulator